MRADISDEHTLEFLLAFDGRIHHLEQGYWLKFEVKRIAPTPQRPHGLRYSLTLPDPRGSRLVGFDNAHGVPSQGSRFRESTIEHDHWHRTGNDEGRPYRFTTAEKLLADFETEIELVLAGRGVSSVVVEISDKPKRGP